MVKKRILLLGSTGSIGTSTINCIRRYPDLYELVGISGNTNTSLLLSIAQEFKVTKVCVSSQNAYQQINRELYGNIHFFHGKNALIDLINEVDFDILVNSLVGAAGFKPTIQALMRGKIVALANKESLVIGGDLITSLTDQGHGTIIPIDSEHSAILQCLNGEDPRSIESITITASGGPFRALKPEQFQFITPEQALVHPTWAMGNKITIDSSTLMNKGFEVIEAHHLFKLPYDRFQVVIHPQSIIHSMVTFNDGAVMAQCGVPDMELPIQYALSYPNRLPISSKRLDFATIGMLTFEKPDLSRFPCLELSIAAAREGGTLPTVLNAANEVAVELFLKRSIPFNHIGVIVQQQLSKHTKTSADSIELIEAVDAQTRINVRNSMLHN